MPNRELYKMSPINKTRGKRRVWGKTKKKLHKKKKNSNPNQHAIAFVRKHLFQNWIV